MRSPTPLSPVLGAILLAAAWWGAAPIPAAGEGPVATGRWGGMHIALEVTEGGAAVEYDCATGTIDQPLILDTEGRFEARGSHSPERGGPVREGQEPPRRPARYRGRVEGETLYLQVDLLEPAETLGSFTLVHGREPRLFKCL